MLVAALGLGSARAAAAAVPLDPVTAYAPQFRLHLREKAFPDDPAAALARAKLRFAEPRSRSWRPCTGRGQPVHLAAWDALSVAAVKLGQATRATCYRHRSLLRFGPPVKVTYTSAQLTAPSQSAGAVRPAHWGFYYDLDNATLRGTPPDASKGPPVLVEYRPGRYIVYWLFFDNNPRAGDTHEGDWEHVVVRLDLFGNALAIAYYTHRCAPKIRTWKQLGDARELIEDTHPRVYVALYGHGTWERSGTTVVACLKGFYDQRGEGIVWNTWRVSPLVDATTQPWYGLGVAWGDRGGPLGPGPVKLAGAVPRGW